VVTAIACVCSCVRYVACVVHRYTRYVVVLLNTAVAFALPLPRLRTTFYVATFGLRSAAHCMPLLLPRLFQLPHIGLIGYCYVGLPLDLRSRLPRLCHYVATVITRFAVAVITFTPFVTTACRSRLRCSLRCRRPFFFPLPLNRAVAVALPRSLPRSFCVVRVGRSWIAAFCLRFAVAFTDWFWLRLLLPCQVMPLFVASCLPSQFSPTAQLVPRLPPSPAATDGFPFAVALRLIPAAAWTFGACVTCVWILSRCLGWITRCVTGHTPACHTFCLRYPVRYRIRLRCVRRARPLRTFFVPRVCLRVAALPVRLLPPPPHCVLDFAVPGFTFWLRSRLPDYRAFAVYLTGLPCYNALFTRATARGLRCLDNWLDSCHARSLQQLPIPHTPFLRPLFWFRFFMVNTPGCCGFTVCSYAPHNARCTVVTFISRFIRLTRARGSADAFTTTLVYAAHTRVRVWMPFTGSAASTWFGHSRCHARYRFTHAFCLPRLPGSRGYYAAHVDNTADLMPFCLRATPSRTAPFARLYHDGCRFGFVAVSAWFFAVLCLYRLPLYAVPLWFLVTVPLHTIYCPVLGLPGLLVLHTTVTTHYPAYRRAPVPSAFAVYRAVLVLPFGSAALPFCTAAHCLRLRVATHPYHTRITVSLPVAVLVRSV